ncbi:MAG: cation transporter [Rhodobacteraceae bacterium]|nr:cation transporter [Paracoccaceae bacterium]
MPHDHSGHGHGTQDCGHDHGGGGHHHHAPDVTPRNERVILVALALTFGFMLVELVGGLIAGSLALVADAGHMLTDAAALGLAWAGFHFGRRGGDARRTFGYMRLEILAGFVNALTLIVLVIWIAVEAVARLITPDPVLAGPMFVIATLGLVVNAGVFLMLRQGDRDHVNIRGAMLHVLSDMLGSVAAILAAVVIALTGWTPIDPILSVLLSALILRSAWSLLKSSLNILMEGTPKGVDVGELRVAVRDSVEGVLDVHHVHVWSITSGRPAATMEVQIAAGTDPGGAVRAIKTKLSVDFGIEHSTVEIDWDRLGGACALDPRFGPGDAADAHDRADEHTDDDGAAAPRAGAR